MIAVKRCVALAIVAVVILAPVTQIVRLIIEYPGAALDVALPFAATAAVVWGFGTTIDWRADRRHGADPVAPPTHVSPFKVGDRVRVSPGCIDNDGNDFTGQLGTVTSVEHPLFPIGVRLDWGGDWLFFASELEVAS